MSFGGYKFAGYKVDDSYSLPYSKLLSVHIARIRAFINASNLAGSPWKFDPAWLNGERNYDVYSGDVIEYGANDGNIHTLLSYNSSVHGYATYFKYKKKSDVGYYCIMTIDRYGIDYNADDSDIRLPSEVCLIAAGDDSSNGNQLSGPTGASCFHCLSLDPFGVPESGDEYKPHLYLLNDNQRATKLTSIGYNNVDTYAKYNECGGLVNSYNYTALFGYCIKDKDIISICGCCSNNEYENPFSSNNGLNTHVNIMSLEGLSELYNKDDTYKLLQLDIKNSADYGYYNETDSNQYLLGNANQVLDESGQPLIFSSDSHYYKLYIPCDTRTFYSPSSASSIPYSGIPICLKDVAYSYTQEIPFKNSNQYFKGCTNPELAAMNFSDSPLQNEWYTKVADGSLLYLNYYESQADSIYMVGQNDTMSSPQYWMSGYFNFYIGWDSENPDIRFDDAWCSFDESGSRYDEPEHDYDVDEGDMMAVYRTDTFEFNNEQYYYEVSEAESDYQDVSVIEGAELNISVGTDYNNEPAVVLSVISDNIYSSNASAYLIRSFSNTTWYGINYSYYISIDSSYIMIKLYNADGTLVQSQPESQYEPSIGPLTFNKVMVPAPGPDTALRTENFTVGYASEYFRINDDPYYTTINSSDLIGASVDISLDTSDGAVDISLELPNYTASGRQHHYGYTSTSTGTVYYLIPNETRITLYYTNGDYYGDVTLELYDNTGNIKSNGHYFEEYEFSSSIHVTVYDPTQAS